MSQTLNHLSNDPRTVHAAELDPRDAFYQLAAKNPAFSREDFAELMGVEKQSIDRWFAQIRHPNRTARRLAAELVRLSKLPPALTAELPLADNCKQLTVAEAGRQA